MKILTSIFRIKTIIGNSIKAIKKMKGIISYSTISIFLILSMTSCSKNMLKKFYYPVNDKKCLVYIYSIDKSEREYEYWKVTSDPSENKLLTESFTSDLELYNTFEEQITKEGADLIRYLEYERTNNKEEKIIKAKILYKDIYKWDVDGKCKYAVSFTSKHGRIRMDKERKFIGIENIQIGDKLYETAKFKGNYIIEAIDYKDKYEYYQFSYYAQNIGMVKYERYLPDGKTRVLELKEILSLAEFEKIKNKASR